MDLINWSLLSILGIISYFIYRKVNWSALKLLWILANSSNSITSHLSSPQTQDNYQLHKNDNCGIVNYSKHGQSYKFYIPFRREYVIPMNQLNVDVLINDGDLKYWQNITQQPGLPYLISAKMMGGSVIRVSNLETGKSRLYSADEVPYYADCQVLSEE